MLSSKPSHTHSNLINPYSLAGMSATLVGVGIGRFAYIALMPALIHAGWFNASEASYLGAATLFGYILGAPASSYLTKYLNVVFLVRIAMLLSSFSFLGCAIQDAPFSYYFVLRSIAGTTGAMLMILAPPLIVRLHRPEMKARVSGIIFSGVGLGVMLAGTLLPLIISTSISAAWLVLGLITLLASALSWRTWSISDLKAHYATSSAKLSTLSSAKKSTLLMLVIAYSLDALGYLPHTLFWVDFIVRDLGQSLAFGGLMWAIFGIGAALGPLLAGMLGDKFNLKSALYWAFLLKSIGVFMPLVSTHSSALALSSLLVGLFTTGTVALVSAYSLECVGYELNTKAWGMLTMAFALSQGGFGYLYANLAPSMNSYQPLFAFSSAALIVALLCIKFSQSNHNHQNKEC